MINRAGGRVLYLPPYCFDLTPLDNGAFGAVKRWLQHHEKWAERVGLRVAMQRALEELGRKGGRDARKAARRFFRLCYGASFV